MAAIKEVRCRDDAHIAIDALDSRKAYNISRMGRPGNERGFQGYLVCSVTHSDNYISITVVQPDSEWAETEVVAQFQSGEYLTFELAQ